MKRIHEKMEFFILSAGLLSAVAGVTSGTTRYDLRKRFDLAGPQTSGIRCCLQETRLFHFGLDGKPAGTEVFRMKLEWNHAAISGGTGDGIQDLKSIGDRTVHASAFTDPPVNLGNLILPGSKLKTEN